MKKYPPVVLVETWLFLALNRNHYEIEEKQLDARRSIKEYFGSMELAQLYIDAEKGADIKLHTI